MIRKNMMKKTRLAIMVLSATCLWLVINTSLLAKTNHLEFAVTQGKQFESAIAALYDEYNLQGDFLIGVVGENGLIYSKQFNRKLLSGEQSSLNNETPFYIASHTKALTATLLKQVEESEQIDLDKSLHYYLPNLLLSSKIDTKRITVRHLLNHTSGFTSVMHSFKTAFLGFENGDQELIEALNHKTLSAPVGQFRYSNTGPIIAAMILEKVTGNSWKREMQQRIFEPLGMHKTSSMTSDYNKETILPSIEVDANNNLYRTDFYKSDSTMHAAGGTISTINDLAKWLRFNINQESSLLSNKQSFKELHQATTTQNKKYYTYQRTGYSLGWDIATYNEQPIITRFGGNAGISFHASFMPKSKIGVIAVSNDQRAFLLPHLAANYVYNLALKNKIAWQLFEKEKRGFKRAFDREVNRSLSNSMLLPNTQENDKYLGVYVNNEGWPEIRIEKLDDIYHVQWGLLTGKLLASNNSTTPLLVSFGPLNREMSIVNDNGIITLTNGSIKFQKENNSYSTELVKN
jgi:CubicO group peptidase (beta-lactamase class C family)